MTRGKLLGHVEQHCCVVLDGLPQNDCVGWNEGWQCCMMAGFFNIVCLELLLGGLLNLDNDGAVELSCVHFFRGWGSIFRIHRCIRIWPIQTVVGW